ncbi:hypothetical protein A0H81_10014 [Grifola frondosa]|uniref:Uncharacterized protein n=1 Tax=Grifola frondosa TaxID=5627 RepID=A0A1C7M135_GRIFR|nr:hypothetical protein A0H81_10014 [Grifola frondosa]
MGRMSDFFQKVRSPRHYSDVLVLDDELLKFMQALPPHYALDPDTSLDQSHPYIPLHRFLLVTEILFVRITLNRPYLLRRLESDRYLRSRNACFESALKDFQMRQAYLASTAKEARDPVASAYREFQAAMIAGIYLVLYPKGKDTKMMFVLVDTFLRNRERIAEMDDITRREIKILEFLKSRSQSAAGSGENLADHKMAVDSPSVAKKPHTDAQLLLGLHKSPGPLGVSPSLLSGPSFANSNVMAPMASSSSAHQKPAYTQHPSYPSPVQQLQHAESSSQSGTGSPSGDDDSTAQSLLDQWCNIFSGGPAVDDTTGATGLPWGTPGLADLSGWLGASASPLLGNEPLPGVDGSDWSYWETLVNQIRSGPVT